MAVTWKIRSFDILKAVGSLSDVVQTIHWEAEDSQTVGSGDSAQIHYGKTYGCISLAEPSASSFTTYSDVTEENAIEWLKDRLGSDEVTKIESDIASQITESKNPTKTSGVPW
tara:strand:- start:762 stop:1100 length:339 start_codon:yes stop_codon:yes gene_type:complete